MGITTPDIMALTILMLACLSLILAVALFYVGRRHRRLRKAYRRVSIERDEAKWAMRHNARPAE